jgi:beta-glucosidase
MPWIDQVAAVLEAWYPGTRGGQAIASILFGDVNPSAKLPVTFAKTEADLPHPTATAQPAPREGDEVEAFPGAPWKVNKRLFDIEYDEGLLVGYKWFDAKDKQPLFPFGFGLSYTTYGYSDLKVSPAQITFEVKNTGERAGAEIAEVYATLPQAAGEPFKRLVAFQKITLAPGESKTVALDLNPHYLSIFNEAKNGWELVAGEYTVQVGGSSRDLPLNGAFRIGD